MQSKAGKSQLNLSNTANDTNNASYLYMIINKTITCPLTLHFSLTVTLTLVLSIPSQL